MLSKLPTLKDFRLQSCNEPFSYLVSNSSGPYPELPKVFNLGISLESRRNFNYGLGPSPNKISTSILISKFMPTLFGCIFLNQGLLEALGTALWGPGWPVCQARCPRRRSGKSTASGSTSDPPDVPPTTGLLLKGVCLKLPKCRYHMIYSIYVYICVHIVAIRVKFLSSNPD